MIEQVVDRDQLILTINSMVHEYVERHGRSPRTLIAVGGSAMSMHGLRSLSEDIDLYSPDDAFAPIAVEIERASGLRIDVTSKTTLWGILNIHDIEKDAVVKESVIIDGFMVDIAAISPETLFVIKASTMRNKDRDDLPLILLHTSPERIMQRLESLLKSQDDRVAEETLLNVISELQLVELSPVNMDWFELSPGLVKTYGRVLSCEFGINPRSGVISCQE